MIAVLHDAMSSHATRRNRPVSRRYFSGDLFPVVATTIRATPMRVWGLTDMTRKNSKGLAIVQHRADKQGGQFMKRIIAPATLVALATVFVLGILPRAQASDQTVSDERRKDTCSNASLRGSFGFTSQGALVANFPPPVLGPFGEIGRQTFDGRGNTEGAATLSGNGNINRVTFQGTYVVNPDCTGDMTLYVSPFGSTVNLDFVIDDDGAELRAIVTGTGTVETRVYQKQFSRGRKD